MTSDFGSLQDTGRTLLPASDRTWPGGETRTPVLLSVAISAFGAIAAIAVAAALWLAPLDTAAPRAVTELQLATAQLALESHASGDTDSGPAIDQQVLRIDRDFEVLTALVPRGGTLGAALAPALDHWRQLRTQLGAPMPNHERVAGLRLQALLTEALAAGVEADHLARQRQRDALLGLASLGAAGIILWAALTMRRHRHHLRAMMRRFSAELGAGSWQDAVQTLRNERSGPPSAWDALASGVESVLGESDRRWQALADLAADWYWETDTRHRLAWMSGAAPPISAQGWSLQRMMGHRYDAIECFEAPAEGWERFHARLDARKAFRELEFRILSKNDGPPVWVAISGRPRQDVSGRFAGYEGVGRDVTERRLALEQLRLSEQRWSLMAGLASDYYWETDAEHRLRPLQPEMSRRFGHVVERLEGRTRWEAHAGALSAEKWAEHRADLDARRPFRGLQIEVDMGDGQFLWLSISGIPRFGRQGEFLGYHGVGRDVTMRKQAERLLLRHNEELQRAVAERTRELEALNHDLDAFARQLAHELRTPIGHVQGLAHLLEARAGEQLAGEDRHLLTLQIQAARQMRDTVDALLLLARSSMQPMAMEQLDLSAIAAEVVAELPPLKRIAPVVWRIDEGMQARGSSSALRIVLANLLGNAAKFTRHVGEPVVHVSACPAPDQRIVLTVRDNGAGFDQAGVDRLFKPFSRLHKGEDFQGTGIGLSIVQRIVERHGGQVSADGEPGRGASFTITLAAGEAAAAPVRT